jgi:YD repeat-containing protein
LTTFSVSAAQATVPFGINDQGQIVGTSVTGMTGSGFLRDARGRLTAINRPGKTITIAFDINNRGQIVGIALNPEDLASPPPTATAPSMGRMA